MSDTSDMDVQEQIARIKKDMVLIDMHVEEARKYAAEARKRDAEQAKLNRDRALSPGLVVGGGVGGITTLVALILRAFNIIH